MSRSVRIALGLAVCFAGASSAGAADPPAKVQVEIRWLEPKPVKDVTEDKGVLASEDPNNLVYPHKKPALVLTAAEVEKTVLKRVKFGAGEQFMVDIHLTQKAREKLAATVEGKETRLLTITVDGHHWGVHRYEKDKDKKFVSDDVRAETYRPGVGFFRSEAEAQRLIDSLK